MQKGQQLCSAGPSAFRTGKIVGRNFVHMDHAFAAYNLFMELFVWKLDVKVYLYHFHSFFVSVF